MDKKKDTQIQSESERCCHLLVSLFCGYNVKDQRGQYCESDYRGGRYVSLVDGTIPRLPNMETKVFMHMMPQLSVLV